MGQAYEISLDKLPLWRRIVDFPLVALFIAVMVYGFAVMLAVGITNSVVVPIAGFGKDVTLNLVGVVTLVAAYKLVIRHLGTVRRDDLRLKGALRPLGIGLLAGALLFSLVVAIAWALHVYRIVGEGNASGLVAALITSAFFPAVSEEMLFRGILFRWIEAFGGSWAALLLTSIFFGAAHLANPHASAIGAIGIALEAGIMLGAAYMLTRSLWLPMGLHAAWNFAQGEVYDIPVSGMQSNGLVDARLSGPPLLTGNGFGLEASIIAMIAAFLFGLWLLWLAIRKGELMSPWWVRRRVLSRV